MHFELYKSHNSYQRKIKKKKLGIQGRVQYKLNHILLVN